MNGFDLIDDKLVKFQEEYDELPELIIIGINVYYDVYKYMKMCDLGCESIIERDSFLNEHLNTNNCTPMINGIPYKISSSINENEVILLGSSYLELQRNHKK